MSTRAQIEFYDDQPAGGEFGEPAARIYQHGDGYPSGVLPRLTYLEKLLSKSFGMYGTRSNDPEWAATEFVSQFRLPHNYKKPENYAPVALHDGTLRGMLQRIQGSIYVTQTIHSDIAYLYRVVVSQPWKVLIFKPVYDESYDITSFEDVTDKFTKTGKEK